MAQTIIQQILATLARAQIFLATHRRRIAAGILAALFVSLAIAGAGIVRPRKVDIFNPLANFSSSDFDDYFQASRTFQQGEDPYRLGQINDLFSLFESSADLNNPLKILTALEKLKGVGTYLYPPFTAFLLTPLTDLSYEVAAGIFQTLSLLALAGFLLIIFRLHRFDRKGDAAPFFLAAAAAMVLLYRFLDGNAGNGNIGFFLIFLCGAGLVLVLRGPAGLEFGGGVLLGLATVMKITPGFFGLVLLGGRRFVGVFGMGFGAALALLAPALSLGWQRNLELLGNWNRLILQTFSQMSFVRPWMNNQSIPGAIGKLFVPASDPKQAAYGLPLDWADVQGPEDIAVFAQGVKAANLALVGLGLIVALVVAWRGRGASIGPERRTLAQIFSPDILRLTVLAALISLLVAGVSWYHAYSILFVPVLVRLCLHWSGDWSVDRWDGAWLAVFGFFGIAQSLLPRAAREGLALYSVFAFLCFAIVLLLAGRVVFGSRAPQTNPSEGGGA